MTVSFCDLIIEYIPYICHVESKCLKQLTELLGLQHIYMMAITYSYRCIVQYRYISV